MNKEVELAVVIPVYNEEDVIEQVLRSWYQVLLKEGINFEIHAYNDGSKDDSLSVMESVANDLPNIFVYDKANSGHGPTVLQGYRQNSYAQWIFQVDSDNEMSAQSFPKLWSVRSEYDLLLGSREGWHGPPIRSIVSGISRLVIWLFYGFGVYYVNSPYRLMRSEAFKNIFQMIPQDTFAPNLILTGLACYRKFRLFEMKVEYHFRQTGIVSIKRAKLLRVACRSFWQTVKFRTKICQG